MSGARAFARTLRELAKVPARVAPEASDEINTLLQEGFDAGIDPYGNAWTALAPATLAKGRTPPPLTDTHAMRDGTQARPLSGAGIGLEAPTPADRHQRGGVFLPVRKVLPDLGLPATWRAAIRDVYGRVLGKAMGR